MCGFCVVGVFVCVGCVMCMCMCWFLMCGCVMCGFCNMWFCVYVGFVMCGCLYVV
jgi:hypothetical protein